MNEWLIVLLFFIVACVVAVLGPLSFLSPRWEDDEDDGLR